MDAPGRIVPCGSQTRSGKTYSLARVILTPIACPPDFSITPLVRAALDAELDALPDIPFDSGTATSAPKRKYEKFAVLEASTAHRNSPDQRSEILFVPFTEPTPTPPLQFPEPCVYLGKRTRTRETDTESTGASEPPNKRRCTGVNTAARIAQSSAAPVRSDAASSFPGPSMGRNPKTLRNKARKKAHQLKKKDEHFLKPAQTSRPEVVRQHLQGSVIVSAKLNPHILPANSSGYEALIKNSSTRKSLQLEPLLNDGYSLVRWNGLGTKAFTDEKTKKIFALGIGKIEGDPTYDASCKAAAHTIHKCGSKEAFTSAEKSHKRGLGWAALNMGVFGGHGPPRPYNLRTTRHDDIAEELLADEHIQRLATMQSAALRLYMPRLYDYYHRRYVAILQRFPNLRPNFPRSVYSAAAFNFGPQVACLPHRDVMNLAFGLCAIHALGDFDYTKGGHLVLVEPRLIIEFPPGALILLPSATITHANIPVGENETRFSFTQYTPGALFRFYDNGFRTEAELEEEDSEEYERVMAAKGQRWEMGIGLWSTLDELAERVEKARAAEQLSTPTML